MQLARAGSSGLASSTVALKLKCAFGSSGLERMGLESGGLEIAFGAGSSGLDSSPKNLKLQSPFGSSGLERIGLEPCGLQVSHSIWLERAREKGKDTLDPSDQTVHFGSQDWIISETNLLIQFVQKA